METQLLLLYFPLLISALTNKEKKIIVDKHNFYRSQPDPPAADMRTLSWDTTLEELATSYAAKCIWEHNEERGFRGENLFMMSGSGLDVDMGLDDWHNERDFYNFTENSCQEGQMCGHYTQMVWADTERVGCGEKFCEKVEGVEDGNMYLLVCNYEPPGNYQGQRPFKTGTPCSACPEGYICKGTLCVDVNVEQKEMSTDLPDTTPELALDNVSELAPFTVVWVPETATELVPGTTSELAPGTTLDLIPEKQSELTSYATVLETDVTTAKAESDRAPTPLPTESLPPVPATILSPDTPASSAVPTAISSTTTSEQILDLTPSSPEDSSFGRPPATQDSSPQMPLGTTDDSSSALPATTMQHINLEQSTDNSNANVQPTEKQDNRITENTDSPIVSTKSSIEHTESSKTLANTIPPTPDLPPVRSPSPIQTSNDQTFSNDGPNPGDIVATVSSTSPASKKVSDEGTPVLVDKDQPKDSPAKATPNPLHLLLLPSKEPNKPPKDKKNPYSDPRTAQKLKKEKEKNKHKAKFPFYPKKDQLQTNWFSKDVKWGFKSSFSVFPLYRTNNASPWGEQYHKGWMANKPSSKKPCKLFGYKSGIYSLYLPSKNMEENLTRP